MELYNRRQPVGGSPIVDSALDTNSTHCVQNKVVASAINEVNSKLSELTPTNVSDSVVLDNGVTGGVSMTKSGNVVTVTADLTLPSSYTTDSALQVCHFVKNYPTTNIFASGHRGYSAVTGVSSRAFYNANTKALSVYCPAGSAGGMKFSFSYITS